MGEKDTPTLEKEIFLENLKGILEILGTKRIDYRLVGGIAVDVYLGEDFNFKRKSGVVRDIDMIVLTPDRGALSQAREEIKAAEDLSKGRGLFPKVSLNQVHEVRRPFKRFGVRIPALLSGFIIKDGRYYLSFNKIVKEVSARVMMKMVLEIEGLALPSFCPETILHLYLVRGGSLKQKDLPKLTGLVRGIAACPTLGLTHKDFYVFHQFAKEMRSEYPFLSRTFEAFFALDNLLGNKISDADRLVYGLWRPIQE